MKKVAILILLICFPMLLSAQSEETRPYVGKEIDKLKDTNGKTIKFKTPAAALMYFISQGWELYVNGATSEGAMVNGIGASETTSYWIIRKPCTQEEFNKTVEEGIRK